MISTTTSCGALLARCWRAPEPNGLTELDEDTISFAAVLRLRL